MMHIAKTRWPMMGLLAQSGVARLSDQMAAVVYGWGLLQQTGESAGAGLVMAASLSGLVIGTLFAGRLIARFGAWPVALAGVWISFAAAAAIALLFLTGQANPMLIAIIAAIGASLDGPAAIASETNYPEIARISRFDLVRLNAIDDGLDHGASVVAPAAGAAIVAAFGVATGTAGLAVLGFLAAAAMTVALPKFRHRLELRPNTLTATLRFIRQDQVLLPLTVLFSLVLAGFVMMQLVLLPRMVHDAGLGANMLTLFLVTVGMSGILAGLGATWVAAHVPLHVLVCAAFVTLAAAPGLLTFGLLTFGMDRWTLIAAGVLIGLPAGILSPVAASLFQVRPPKALRADVQSVSGALIFAAAPAAVLGGAMAADAMPPVILIVVLSAVFLVLGIIAAFWLPHQPALPTGGEAQSNSPKLPERRFSGTVSLARSSLIYEWRRYLAAVMAVAFSGLLVIVQIALLLGLFETVTTVVDKSAADLWVSETTVQSFDLARDMPGRVEFRVRSNKDVARVERLQLAFGDWRAPDGRRVAITLVGLNVDDDSLGFPQTTSTELRAALRQPGTVLVDEQDMGKLGIEADGQRRAEINGNRVSVAGVVKGFRAVGGAMIFVSEATFRELRPSGSVTDTEATPYYLLRLTPGADREAVKKFLNDDGKGLFKAMTPEELSVMSQSYWLFESGTGAGFLFSTVLGLLVGVAITSQTLRAAVLASLREYATLRALGIPLGVLRMVVLEQSFWVGIAGLLLTALGAGAVWWIAAAAGVAVTFTWWAGLGTAVFTMSVSLVSGLLSLGPLFKTEPAELLR